MPLELKPPRQGQSKNWRIRGTYLGVSVDQTTKTPDKKLAAKMLAQVKSDIERGTFSKPTAPTFASEALKYIEAGGEERFVLKLAEHFKDTPIEKIDQAAIDAAALALYPRAAPATRNRQVYSPISAILKSAGLDERLKRPKGAKGQRRLFFMTPDQAGRLLDAASDRDPEFGIFLAFLLYTGCRLSETISATIENLNISESWIFIQKTKNDDPRMVHLPPGLVSVLACHPRGLERGGKLFRFGKNGRLYTWLDAACKASGVLIPDRVAFHAFRHTWGAWMRRYGGLDTTGLVETGAWRSRKAAEVYEHAVQSEEAKKADALPIVCKIRVKERK